MTEKVAVSEWRGWVERISAVLDKGLRVDDGGGVYHWIPQGVYTLGGAFRVFLGRMMQVLSEQTIVFQGGGERVFLEDSQGMDWRWWCGFKVL